MIAVDHINRRHSRLGITSIIIGGGLPLLVIVVAVVSLALNANYNYRSDFVNTVGHSFDTFLVIVFLIALPLHLMGLIFALIGVFSKKTKKAFPIAGIVLNSLFGLIGIAIAILGFYALMRISHT